MVTKIGIIGLGNVGQSVVRSIQKYSALVNRRTSLKIEIKGLCDNRKKKYNVAKKFSLPFTTNALELINDPEIDTIVELIGGIEPAYTFITQALKEKKNIVTANKALLSEKGKAIFSLAKKMGKTIGFEASVCGAIPLIQGISEGLVSCEVKKIYGILNGTTNYILHKMSKEKVEFNYALREAQHKGLAERNPSFDIEGKDAAHKLCILGHLCFGVWPNPRRVHTEGISKISLSDILYAEELNYRIKLLAIAKRQGSKVDLRVHPTLISMDHPLSDTAGAYNAVYLDTEPAGELLFYGQGAGGIPTSSSVISDIVSIALDGKNFLRKEESITLYNIKKLKTRYYIRFNAKDEPGALANISKILSACNISISSVNQKEHGRARLVSIVMITHEAKEEDMQKALRRIDKLSLIKSPTQLIRIENL